MPPWKPLPNPAPAIAEPAKKTAADPRLTASTVTATPGEPRLFRTDRAQSATVLTEPARRRDGLELAEVWDTLRRGIDDTPAPLAVTARVRDEVLAMFLRVHAADLATPAAAGPTPAPEDEPGWTRVELRFRSHLAAQPLLAFGPDVEVLTPEDLRRALADKAEATAALYTLR